MTNRSHIIHVFRGLLLICALCFAFAVTAAEKTPPFFDEKKPLETDRPDAHKAADPKAQVDQALVERGFTTQEYVVKEGDWLTKILKEKGVLEDYDTDELLKILRRLNQSLKDINVIRPGEKIVILVKVMPKVGETRKAAYHTYTIRRGDTLHKLAVEQYGLSDKTFTRRYLPLLKKYNPDIEDLDLIQPGQKIRLPVYPPPSLAGNRPPSEAPVFTRDVDRGKRVVLNDPKIVTRDFDMDTNPSPPPSPPPLKKASPEPPPAPEPPQSPKPPEPREPRPVPPREQVRDIEPAEQEMVIVLADGMGNVFEAMGEEWVDEGEHFIPMPSGGQINLKTENYPILRSQLGRTVIVDLSGALPQKMVRLIQSAWPSYRVVPIVPGDDLRSAVGKILKACKYARIFKPGEPLELGGSVPLRITGDWIVAVPDVDEGKNGRFVLISLLGPGKPPLPGSIKDYLNLMGIEVLEYPPGEAKAAGEERVPPAGKASDTASLIEAVLDVTGRIHNTGYKIKAFSSRKDDFALTVEADFYFENQGREAVVDLDGMDPKVISLLKDRGVEVLSLSGEEGLVSTLGKLLTFLHIRYEKGPHTFTAVEGSAPTNVRFTLPGVVFQDEDGESVIATDSSLPPQIVRFLARKGYRVLVLSDQPSKEAHHA